MKTQLTVLGMVAALAMIPIRVLSQDAPIIPPPTFTGGGYDPNAGVAYFQYTGFVPGAYYMIGVQYDNLDPTNQFQPWSDPFQASDTNLVFVTDDPYYDNAAFYIILPFQLPQSTFNFSNWDTISNTYTFVATATTNVTPYQRQLYIGDDYYSTLLAQGVATNTLFAALDTQTRPSGYYYVDDYFVLPGFQMISGWEVVTYTVEGYVDIENPFFAYYPPSYVTGTGLGSPNWTFVGVAGNAYTATLSSVSADRSVTNLLATADVSGDTTTANGGGFAVAWDAVNDNGGPLYLVQVFDNGPDGDLEALDGPEPRDESPGGPVFQNLSGSFNCAPYCSWLHAAEEFTGWPYQDWYNTALDAQYTTGDLITWLYPLDWDNIYQITQTEYDASEYAPFPWSIASQRDVTNLLQRLNITNASPYTDRYVSEFTAFGHMNPEGVFGGAGSPLTDNDGFEYTDLAAARGTTLDTTSSSSPRIVSTKGALKCMILEGCDSIAENQALFRAAGIPLNDDPSCYPNWGFGYKHPAVGGGTAVFCERITRTWVQVDGQGNSPTAQDAIDANTPWYGLLYSFEVGGCGDLYSQYMRYAATDQGYHTIFDANLFTPQNMTDTGSDESQSDTVASLGSSSAPLLRMTSRPQSHSDAFLSAPRTAGPVANNPSGTSLTTGRSARKLRLASTGPSGISSPSVPQLATGLWKPADFEAAIAPIRAQAQARRAQTPITVLPAVLQAVAAGQDYYLSDPPPMPPVPVRGNDGKMHFVPWEDVYGPVPPLRIPISDGQRAAAALQLLQSSQNR